MCGERECEGEAEDEDDEDEDEMIEVKKKAKRTKSQAQTNSIPERYIQRPFRHDSEASSGAERRDATYAARQSVMTHPARTWTPLARVEERVRRPIWVP